MKEIIGGLSNHILRSLEHLSLLLVTVLCLLLAGCFGGGAEIEDGDPNSPSFRSSCGAAIGGEYENPVPVDRGQSVSFVGAPAGNLVILRSVTGENLLVRILGLTAEPASRRESAVNFIRNFSGGGLLYFPAGCEEDVPGGGRAALGSIFNRSGQNLSEGLVRSGLVLANPNDSCSGAEVGRCLEALSQSEPITAGELPRFLWKPISDNDGGLAIHTGPFGTTVVVNGVTGVNRGPGNGYGSLARFTRPGCAFGSPQIQVFSSQGLLYTVNGQTTFTVPNSCGRYCVEGGNGSVFSCPK